MSTASPEEGNNMADKVQGEIDEILRRIDQEPGDRWSNRTAEENTATGAGEAVEPEAADITETIHVYIVRESELGRPPDNLVVESELVANDDDLAPDEDEGHSPPMLCDDDRSFSLTDEDRKRCIHAFGTAGLGFVLLVASIVILIVLTLLTPTPTITLAQTRTVPATGKGHQDAQDAVGTITFYNGLLLSQTVAAGTRLPSSDGVQVVTDHAAVIPPAQATTPPTYGQVTVFAHATQAGPQGNIPMRGVNEACCLPSVLAQNTVAFQGGQSERDYPVVTRADLDHVVTSLTATLTQGEYAALRAQLSSGEALVPPTCTPTVTADHRPGEEAAAVTVTVAEHCTAIAYESAALQDEAVSLFTQEATRQLGTRYGLIGTIQVRVLQAALTTDQEWGITTMSVRVEGIWSYQFSQDELQRIKRLVAGKTPRQARRALLRVPGIQRVSIDDIGENQGLPKDIASIHLLLLYEVG
jgi:hypothetical protein